MKVRRLAAAALVGLLAAAPAAAQHEGHSGYPMPAPAPNEGEARPEPDARAAPAAEAAPDAMTGALGPYALTREASGTAWQPDSSPHRGLHGAAGRWTLMGHGLLNLVYDRQDGPRGGDKAFVSGMLMGMARRDVGDGGVLQLRAMVGPDPLMGRRGYPLHLASGETADGVTRLIDRQHPHELVMELSASFGLRLSDRAGAFVYAGLPGEPAFGPPAFMHRLSAMASPEAPITHHWLDSTHIAFGVVTAGLVVGPVKAEASRFNGREPDQNRFDIETGPLDSTALRLSLNPTAELSLQASWARLRSPEQLEPGEDQTRWSASAIWTRRLSGEDLWSTTFAWGRRSRDGRDFDAIALESSLGLGAWTLFGRAEWAENDELLPGAGHGPAFDVAKLSAGAVRDFRVARHVKLGVGALAALNFVPSGLDPLYGGDPKGAMAFLRLRID